jgi:hypothetical protein
MGAPVFLESGLWIEDGFESGEAWTLKSNNKSGTIM